MRHHAIAGEALVSVVPGLSNAAQIVRSHHERFDGTGYPDGLAGEQIPLAARIVAAADAFVAMTESRPYEGPRGTPSASPSCRAARAASSIRASWMRSSPCSSTSAGRPGRAS